MTRNFFIWILAALLIVGLAGLFCYFHGNKKQVKKDAMPASPIPNEADAIPDVVENHGVENDAMSSFVAPYNGTPLDEEYGEEAWQIIEKAKNKTLAEAEVAWAETTVWAETEQAKQNALIGDDEALRAQVEGWRALDRAQAEAMMPKMLAQYTIAKIDDKKILLEVVNKDKDKHMRYYAVLKLGDQAMLAAIAKNTKEEYIVRHYVIQYLTDPAILEDIAKNDEKWEAREIATGRLNNKELLVEIAENDRHPSVRSRAARRFDEIRGEEVQ